MSARSRVVGFVLVLAVALALGLGAGRLTGPPAPAAAGDGGSHAQTHDRADRVVLSPATPDGHAHSAGEGGETGETEQPEGAVGLGTTDGTTTLALLDDRLAAGRAELSFQVLAADGAPVTDYEEQHERDLHLIVVRRDLTGFQHVHPRLDATGTWSVPVELRPGSWRVIADFTPAGGEPTVLGADLAVPGVLRPAGLGADATTSEVAGYRVRLDGLAPAGEESQLSATVVLDGEPVTDLQPYLGAHGHLVALRAGDLGYLHVHPSDDGAGPRIGFATTFPSAGRYRVFLDFRHDDVVRTVPFTVTVPVAPTDAPETPEEAGHDDSDPDTEHGHTDDH